MKTGKSEQSELFLKLKLRNESERSHEDAERVKTDTCPANTETSKRCSFRQIGIFFKFIHSVPWLCTLCNISHFLN